MSYQKKSVILQELEQAIRKKAQQKSRNKQHLGRVLQSSIEKKKHVLKTTTGNKDHRIGSVQKKENQKNGEKHISLFNNEAMHTMMDSHDFKIKKCNNRRFDKLVSLIQYMVSSSQKAVKYISSNNFQAEFALKLYRSDKENLVNEIKNFNIQDLIDSTRGQEVANQQGLVEENNKLKKQLMVLEKEAERYHKETTQEKEYIVKGLEKQNGKLRQMVRKVVPFDGFRQLMELLDKQSKFETMSMKCQQNSRKITQIQIVISSLQTERNQILENISKGKIEQKTDRGQKIIEIQSQKEQLQRQIGILRSKIVQLKQASNVIQQFEILRKNNELVHERIQSLVSKMSNHSLSPSRKSTQILIDYIKEKIEDYIDNNELLQKENNRLKGKVEKMQIIEQQLIMEKTEKEQQLLAIEDKVSKLTDDLIQVKQSVEQLTIEKDEIAQKLIDSQRMFQNKEQQINLLKQKLANLNNHENQKQELKDKYNETKKQIQNLNRRWQDKEKYLKERIDKLQMQKTDLEQQCSEANDQLVKIKQHLNQLLRSSQSHEDQKEQSIRILKEHNTQVQLLKKRIGELESEVDEQALKNDKMMTKYKQINDRYEKINESYQQKYEKVNQLQKQLVQKYKKISTLEQQKQYIDKERFSEQQKYQTQINQISGELQKAQKENERLSIDLRNTHNEMMKNCEGENQINIVKKDNAQLRLQLSKLDKELKVAEQINKQASEKQIQLINQLKESKDKIKNQQEKNSKLQNQIKQITEQKQALQKMMDQNASRQAGQLEQVSQKLHEVQMRIISLNKQKDEYEQLLNLQRNKCNKVSQKVKILEIQKDELRDELQAASDASIAASQKDKQLELERKNMEIQYFSLKQQLEDHSELSKFKIKQYNSLLKQILKGLNIDSEQMEGLNSFEELLEFGSKRVLKMRKQQREEESNKRKMGKKYDSSEEGSPNAQKADLQNVKVQLFSNQETALQEEKKQVSPNDKELDLEEFNEMKAEDSASMISEQDKCNLEEFNDLKSQKMNESMLSRNQQGQNNEEKQDGNNLSDFRDAPEDKVNDSMISKDLQGMKQDEKEAKEEANNLSDFKEISQDKIDDSMISKNEQDIKEQENEDGNNLSDFKEITEDKVNDSMISKDEEDIKQQEKEDANNLSDFKDMSEGKINDSMISQEEHYPKEDNSENVLSGEFADPKVKVQQQEKDQQNANNLSDFKDMSQDRANESMISVENQKNLHQSSEEHENEQPIQMAFKPQIIEDVSQLPQVDHKLSKFMDKKISNFNESQIHQTQQFNYSGPDVRMKSHQQISNQSNKQGKDKQWEFMDVGSENASIMSAKQKKVQRQSLEAKSIESNNSSVVIYPIKKIKSKQEKADIVQNESLGGSAANFDEFNNISEDKMNESMISEKQKEHNLSDFNEMAGEEMNASMMSNKAPEPEIKEERQQIDNKEEQKNKEQLMGIDEFGDIQQDEVNQSLLSEKEHGMSEFGDMPEDSNNQSILSQKSEHGLSEFGQLQNENMNSSVISDSGPQKQSNSPLLKKQKKVEEKKQEKKESSFDEFQQFGGDKLSESMYSETGSKQ